MLMIKDGTYYEGEFKDNIILKGELNYFNGAKFEGVFDGTIYD